MQINNYHEFTTNRTIFSEAVIHLFPDFIRIYQQSECAEQIGLDELCGMGYRKALEYFLKDYLLATVPEKSDKIVQSNSIGDLLNFISDPQLKEIVRAAKNLGNDECHYKRNYSDYTIKELKKLIVATTNYFDLECAAGLARKINHPNLLDGS